MEIYLPMTLWHDFCSEEEMVFCSLMPTVVRVAQGKTRRKLLVARKPSDKKWKQELKELEKQTAKTGERLNRMFFVDVH